MEKSYYPWSQDEDKTKQFAVSTSTDVLSTPTAAQGGEPTIRVSPPGSRALRASTPEAVLDVGALVGLNRNLEFTAGQRAHRISTGSYTRS